MLYTPGKTGFSLQITNYHGLGFSAHSHPPFGPCRSYISQFALEFNCLFSHNDCSVNICTRKEITKHLAPENLVLSVCLFSIVRKLVLSWIIHVLDQKTKTVFFFLNAVRSFPSNVVRILEPHLNFHHSHLSVNLHGAFHLPIMHFICALELSILLLNVGTGKSKWLN